MIKTAVVGCQPYNGRPVLQRGARSWIREDLLPCIYRPGGWAEIEAHAGRLVASIIQTQERLGLDILTEGESTRRDYWSPFVIGLDGVVVDDSGVVTVVAPLAPRSEAVLNEWQLAQSFTQQPVKITLPGPTTCACYVTDSTYGSHEKLSEAFAIVINHYVRRLADLGCRYIQLDDCRLAYYPDIAAGMA